MTKAYDLFASLIPRLRRIGVANGYLTNAGASVMMGPVPKGPDEPYPYIRLHEANEEPESLVPGRPMAKMRSTFIAQAFTKEPVAANVMKTGHDLLGDLKKALFGDDTSDLGRTVIEVRIEGAHVIQPPPGNDVVIAEVRGSYSFTDHFGEP